MNEPSAAAFDPDSPAWRQHWADQWRRELRHRVLPWWHHALYDAQGHQLGARGNDGRLADVPRSAVIGTRLLWTFASAQLRLGPNAGDAQAGQRAAHWMQAHLLDPVHGGVFWSVNRRGQPVQAHKQTYAQAFAIYALVAAHQLQERQRTAGDGEHPPALKTAHGLFQLLQDHAHDAKHGGYVEGCSRDWSSRPDSPMSPHEPAVPRSTNTLLHVLEAFTELQRCSPEPTLAERLRELLLLFLDRLWRPGPRCFGQFFSVELEPLTPQVSWGHDIETAWLLVRAAQVLGDARLLARSRQRALDVADAVLARGMAPDGSLFGAGLVDGQVTDDRRHWWAQAEAIVGFWDAWQIGGDPRHAQAAWRLWGYVQRHHVDPVGGDWFKTLDARGRPIDTVPKAGPWECPYHHVRAGLEMMERLAVPASPALTPAS